MFNIGKILKIDIILAVTAYTIKKGDQTWYCVELVLELVWKLSVNKISEIKNIDYHDIKFCCGWENRKLQEIFDYIVRKVKNDQKSGKPWLDRNSS